MKEKVFCSIVGHFLEHLVEVEDDENGTEIHD